MIHDRRRPTGAYPSAELQPADLAAAVATGPANCVVDTGSGVGVTVFIFRTELWVRTRRAYWLYECMHHVTPPGTVLVETAPAKAAKLLATNPDYVQAISYDPRPS